MKGNSWFNRGGIFHEAVFQGTAKFTEKHSVNVRYHSVSQGLDV